MIEATHRDLDARFPTSGCPTYLEWYECYDDQGQAKWIDGHELIENEAEWDERQKAKWHFFYRPVAVAVGRPQQKRIHQERMRERSFQEERRRLIRSAVTWGVIGAAVVLMFAALDPKLALVPLLAILLWETILWVQLRDLQKRRDLHEDRIAALEDEIRRLRLQMPASPSAVEVEEWLDEELREMEAKCLAEILGGDVSEARVLEIVRQEKLDDLVYGLLVRGWGVLQPAKVNGPLGTESTGISSVFKEIGPRATTWRRGHRGLPLCRLLYLQYVFPLESNLNVYGFFYDFVTRKQYGRRWETYQYNHVASFSVREVEVGEEDCVRDVGLPESFFGKQIHAFTLVMGGGSHFRCVLTDDAVVQAMNEWLHLSTKLRELEAVMIQRREEVQNLADVDSSLAQDIERDLAEIRDQVVRVVEEKAAVQESDVGKARKALRCIRLAVEAMTSRGVPPAVESPSLESATAGAREQPRI